MFNYFKGNADERKAKLNERLAILKRAREDGFFDEEGTEEVTVVAAGINPCDLGRAPFAGEIPEPKPSEFRRPMDVLGSEGAHKSRCWKCRGAGTLSMYSGDLVERCPLCGGTGRDDTLACFVCTGRGYDIHGQRCAICDGRGLEPTQ